MLTTTSIKVIVQPATLLKKRLWHRCFPVNFAKILRTPFLQNTSGRLLLANCLNFARFQPPCLFFGCLQDKNVYVYSVHTFL